MPWIPDWLGSPYHPAYIPNLFMDYTDHMSFMERLENTLMYFFTRLVFKYKMETPGNELSKKYLGEDLLKNGNLMHNISLLLSNTHFSLNLPRPLVPAEVEVAGIHLGTPKPLPSVSYNILEIKSITITRSSKSQGHLYSLFQTTVSDIIRKLATNFGNLDVQQKWSAYLKFNRDTIIFMVSFQNYSLNTYN